MDLSFADAIYHHQEEAAVLADFLGKDDQSVLAPVVMGGAATINIAQGCNCRCSFCKVHYLDYMRLTSRPMEEVLDLVRQALERGIRTIVLTAENSTEYGIDIGTSLRTLLEQILAMEDLRFLDALQDKFLISNLMTGFPGHSILEFNREMRRVRTHHLYYLSLDNYDDTPGVPSHELYQPINCDTTRYYQEIFIRTVAKEHQALLERLMRQPYIESSVFSVDETETRLYASHYTLVVHVEQGQHRYRPGDMVRVKVTGLHESVPGFYRWVWAVFLVKSYAGKAVDEEYAVF